MDNALIIYLIPTIGAGILLFVWQKYFAKRKIKGQTKTKVGEDSIKVRVYDYDNRTMYYQDISTETVKEVKGKHNGSLGRQYTHFGERVYALLLKKGEYSPAPLRVSNSRVTPRELAEDLAIGYSIALFYRPEMPQGASGNIKQILWWTAIIAVIVFLAVVD